MDKVRAKILSVSLLLSLCGAGMALPCTDVSAAIIEALSATDANHHKSLNAAPQKAEFPVAAPSDRRSALSRIRTLFSGLTERLAAWRQTKARLAASGRNMVRTADNVPPGPQLLAHCPMSCVAPPRYPRQVRVSRVFSPHSLRSQWQPLALKCRAGPTA